MDAAHRRHREPGRDLHRALPHEDHVDVADVVEFAGARLAHPDDRQPRGGDLLGGRDGVAPGHLEGGVERGGGEIRQRGGHHVERAERVGLGQVEGGEPHQVPAIAHPERRPGGLLAVDAPHRGEQVGAILGRRQGMPQAVRQRGQLVGPAQQEVGETG